MHGGEDETLGRERSLALCDKAETAKHSFFLRFFGGWLIKSPRFDGGSSKQAKPQRQWLTSISCR